MDGQYDVRRHPADLVADQPLRSRLRVLPAAPRPDHVPAGATRSTATSTRRSRSTRSARCVENSWATRWSQKREAKTPQPQECDAVRGPRDDPGLRLHPHAHRVVLPQPGGRRRPSAADLQPRRAARPTSRSSRVTRPSRPVPPRWSTRARSAPTWSRPVTRRRASSQSSELTATRSSGSTTSAISIAISVGQELHYFKKAGS